MMNLNLISYLKLLFANKKTIRRARRRAFCLTESGRRDLNSVPKNLLLMRGRLSHSTAIKPARLIPK
jgi:hypothetical protein